MADNGSTVSEPKRHRPNACLVSDITYFEYPLNERMRVFLRLEHAFAKLDYFLPLEEDWASRGAVEAMLDIMTLSSRSDLKSEIIKELERQSSNLARIQRQPGVDIRMLGQVLGELEQVSGSVFRIEGAIGQRLRDNEFLKTVSQRSSISGGTCNFDLPQYHHWLKQPYPVRRKDLLGWLQDLLPVRAGIGLILSLARGSVNPTQETARQGFFQRALDPQTPAQMVRIGVNGQASVYPEVSGAKHRFTIRFMEPRPDEPRAPQTDRDVGFLLSCCTF